MSGIIASKIDTAKYFDGCLNRLRKDLTSRIPDNTHWINGVNGIKDLVGTKNVVNAYSTPYNINNPFIEIYFGDKYIYPVAYYLMGRRLQGYTNFLRSWKFSGRNKKGEWILLHKENDKTFSFGENRTYLVKPEEAFNGFRIEMTDTDSAGTFALCLGQIEVYGNIYKSSYVPKNGIIQCTSIKQRFLPHLICMIFPLVYE